MSATVAYKKAFVRLRSQNGVWFVSPDLRALLIAEATEAGTSMSDLGASIIAARFGMRYTSRMRRTRPTGADDEKLLLYLPPDVLAAVQMAAIHSGQRPFDVIRETLSDHFGLPMPGLAAA